MKHGIDPNLDVVQQVIHAVLAAKPDDAFCKSIATQYIERGGLSKKQLEGLHGKATRIKTIPVGKLATLEAIIKKKHITHKSTATLTATEHVIDTEAENMIHEILAKYPQHKRVLVFKGTFDKEKMLAKNDKLELEKFYKILIKKT
jgi:hypothetical protein